LEREQFLADLINKSSSIIVVKSADGEYQLVNEMWEQVFGLNKAIVIGKTDYDLFPLHIRKQLLCSHNDVIATGSTLEHETIIESGNKIRYFLYTSFPIHDARGRINGICSIGMEITDRKIADEERLALARAEATSQAKSTFLKNISRDIRSPLNTIIGITQTLQNNSTSPHSEQINSIHRSTRQLMSLVNNIFDFSKLETGSLQLLMSDFSLAVLLDDIQAMYSEKAIEKGVEVRLIMESGVPESIRSDESRLRQILINVVGNAVKFTTDGYVQIKVSAKRNLQRMLSPQTKYDFELTFEISDSGKGISQNQLSSIFTTFRQSRVPTDKSGSGLGLAITKALVDLMSGTIHVDSELKNGSRFTIKLPVNKISRL
jgi:PAS domain S-box-containing protein